MFRLVVLLIVFWFSVLASDLPAQNRHGHHQRYEQSAYQGYHSPTANSYYGRVGVYGYSNGAVPYYGFQYAYDPYRSGSFQPPDLLEDPWFRAQHKFDSHYPGRYSRRPPLRFKSSAW